MKNHLFMAVAAVSILLTTAALAANSSSTTHQRRAGDRYTVMTRNEQLMCKVAGNEASRSWSPPPAWTNAIVHLRQEGDIRCAPRSPPGY